MEFRTIKVKHNTNCGVCGDHPIVTELIDYEQAYCEIKSRH